jgi:transcriptional regulator with GAF, ATPase, and Fis domain
VALQVRVKERDEVVIAGAWERLLLDPFHGNVRELQNALVRIATVAPGPLRCEAIDRVRGKLDVAEAAGEPSNPGDPRGHEASRRECAPGVVGAPHAEDDAAAERDARACLSEGSRCACSTPSARGRPSREQFEIRPFLEGRASRNGYRCGLDLRGASPEVLP